MKAECKDGKLNIIEEGKKKKFVNEIEHITFSGMNPEITLRDHQRNAIAHTLYGGNTLLAHVVGA